MTDAATTTTIEQTVHIAASPATVWTFWTDPERLAEWWAVSAEVEAVPGGRYRVVLDGGPVMLGAFVELDPPRRLVFTFGWEGGAPAGPLPPGSSTVEVTLRPDAGGTALTLRHTLPATHAADHRDGWAWFVGGVSSPPPRRDRRRRHRDDDRPAGRRGRGLRRRRPATGPRA